MVYVIRNRTVFKNLTSKCLSNGYKLSHPFTLRVFILSKTCLQYSIEEYGSICKLVVEFVIQSVGIALLAMV